MLACDQGRVLHSALPLVQVTDSGITAKGQSEINLANSLALKDRQEIYKNFLIQSISGRSHALRMFSQREAPHHNHLVATLLLPKCVYPMAESGHESARAPDTST